MPISMKTGLLALMCSVSTRTPTALSTPACLAQPSQFVPVDRARQRVRRALLGHREVSLADGDDGGGRLLEAAAGDVECHDRHHGDSYGEGQAERAGLLPPQVAEDEFEEGHGIEPRDRSTDQARWRITECAVLHLLRRFLDDLSQGHPGFLTGNVDIARPGAGMTFQYCAFPRPFRGPTRVLSHSLASRRFRLPLIE